MYDLWQQSRKIIAPIITIFLLGYFTYHTIQGERGLLSWRRLHKKIEVTQEQLLEAQEYENTLARRVRLLRPDSLDVDMLEEQARQVLNFAHETDIIIPDSDLLGANDLSPSKTP